MQTTSHVPFQANIIDKNISLAGSQSTVTTEASAQHQSTVAEVIVIQQNSTFTLVSIYFFCTTQFPQSLFREQEELSETLHANKVLDYGPYWNT